MTLPAAGAISLNQVKTELGRLSTDRMELGEYSTRLFASDTAYHSGALPMSFDQLRGRGAVGFRAYMGSLDDGAVVGARFGDGINTFPNFPDHFNNPTDGPITMNRAIREVSAGFPPDNSFGYPILLLGMQGGSGGWPNARYMHIFRDDFTPIGFVYTMNAPAEDAPIQPHTRSPDYYNLGGSGQTTYLGWHIVHWGVGPRYNIPDLRPYAGSWLRFVLYRF